MVKNPPAMQEMQEKQFQSLGQEDPLQKEMATHFSTPVVKKPELPTKLAPVSGCSSPSAALSGTRMEGQCWLHGGSAWWKSRLPCCPCKGEGCEGTGRGAQSLLVACPGSFLVPL